MIKLLDQTDPKDVQLLQNVFAEISQQDNPVYYPEGLKAAFDYYLTLFKTVEEDPAKQMYVSAEIINKKIVRMVITCTMNKLWPKSKGLVPYFALLFWYTAPGHTKENPIDNRAGKLAFDKFIEQGMFTYISVFKGPKYLKGMNNYRKIFKTMQRIDVYIDKYIDSQQKLDRLRTILPGYASLLPSVYKKPLITYTGVIKPEHRQYENF